ncbi:MAG: ATP:cob(I)alamin adenosyltransferase [Rhodospirillales bacterium RIFCSPLOWO2_12_FULL_58_28]|nr:MAG: ATP:cob(I)alamin adenosyltransferase [Rhodospirillales bacterium RIFCSPLOWO2_02_FULL_58_16]OHC77647.1 MAG: ATP:cob(I)alamin adenosyltransferase [Rhodospirillales bacterium RIFCSPLOWO2_12_FULL_58_28]
MVKLDKIYTRGGDGGKTSLGNGKRVVKHDPAVVACGAIDEANAAIGVARLHTDGEAGAMLGRIQNDLFNLGADLSCGGTLRITDQQVKRLESEIDALNAGLEPLDSFILPGGSPASACLHMARTVTRRAECLISGLAGVNPAALCYVNRLSDHLFVLARHLNNDGADDVLWAPGTNR